MATEKTYHKKLLKKFHTLCSVAGLSAEEKLAIVCGCGVESSVDIGVRALEEICRNLERQVEGKKYGELDRLRKRAMAAIGGWLVSEGRQSNADIIKAIACRATGHDSFNKIPVERLRNLYYTFGNKQKDKRSVAAITAKAPVPGVIILNAGRTTAGKFIN